MDGGLVQVFLERKRSYRSVKVIAAAIVFTCFGVAMIVQMGDVILHQHAVLNPNRMSTTIFLGLFIIGLGLPITIWGMVWAIRAILGKVEVIRIDEKGITQGKRTYPWNEVSGITGEAERFLWQVRISLQFYSDRRRSWIPLYFDRSLTKKEFEELAEKLEQFGVDVRGE